mmetsp:Transcript_62404/g.122567  ORF Transcript_62404/g.122567 Transcript_62404/m.122567 type:complete len:521 (+) Transcript_62404:134-1696(+)
MATRNTIVVGTGAAAIAAVVLLLWKRKRRGEFSPSEVSSRGKLLTLPSLPYMGGVIQGFTDPYDADTNPDGVILLAVAENKLCWEILEPRIRQGFATVPQWAASYGPMHGFSMLRDPLAAFMGKHIYRGAVVVDPEDLVVGVGLSSILSSLFTCICEEGDSVLIPAPYYSAFDNDLRAFAGIERAPVYLDCGSTASSAVVRSVDALEQAYSHVLASKGAPPRALLLTNPHNPLGVVMGRVELEAVVAWCDSKPGLHLVSDEIYALSVFGHLQTSNDKESNGRSSSSTSSSTSNDANKESGSAFLSLGVLCSDQKEEASVYGGSSGGSGGDRAVKFGAYRHVLWGLSKDLGVSGFRVGVLWSQNQTLLAAMQSAAVFSSVPGPVQAMVADVLSDDAFMASYIRENSARLSRSCRTVTGRLEALGLPVTRAEAGMFVWADFRPLLPLVRHKDSEGAGALESALYEALLAKPWGLCLTPGMSQHAKEAGFFRICYAFVSPAVLSVALDKIEAFVKQLRKKGPL